MIYGYARVSTVGQGKDGNSPGAQVQALKQRGCVQIIQEVYTGKTMDRPKFIELLAKLDQGDLLVIFKLDRFARTTSEGLNIIQNLLKRNVSIHILNMGYIDSRPNSKLILTIFLAFAEFERSQIVERTQTGKAIAKQKPGFVEGRPKKYGEKQIQHALNFLDTHSYKQVEELTGISKSTLIRAKNKAKCFIHS